VTQTKEDTRVQPAAASTQTVEKPRRVEKRAFVIRPAPRWPHLDFGELWHYREVLWTIVWRDIKVRYKQTFLGVAWAILVPAFTAAVYVIVFGKFAKFPSGNTSYPSLVVAGVIPTQYFASALTASSLALVTNMALVTKVYFPRVLLPFSAVLTPLVDLIVGLPVLLVLMAMYGTWPQGIQLVTAPAFLFLALVTALGGGFFLAALNVRYRDVPYIIPVFLQVLPLVSGVMYEVDSLPEKWQWLLSLNPITTVIAGWRWAVLGAPEPNWAHSSVGVAVSIMIFLIGLTVFRTSEPRFADTM
jgi:lipopolysaccharide transport system permease protein